MQLRLLFTGLILLSGLCFEVRASWAQNDNQADQPITAKLDALTMAINRLTTLLEREQLQEQNRLQLAKMTNAIDYLNFRSRRIEMLERDLASLRISRQGQEDLLKLWDENLRECDNVAEPKSSPNPEVESDCKRLLNRQKMVKDKMARLNDEIVVLENRLYELQNELVDVENYVQKNLGDFN